MFAVNKLFPIDKHLFWRHFARMKRPHPLRTWRKGQKMTLAALSEELGIKPPHLSLIETRNSRPSLDLAIKIRRKTGIPIEEMI